MQEEIDTLRVSMEKNMIMDVILINRMEKNDRKKPNTGL
jgi:hypothetical protein